MSFNEVDWDDLYNQIDAAPNGKASMEICRKAWELADKYHYYDGQIDYRLQYMSQSVYYDDILEIFVVYPQIIKLHDEHIKEHGYDENTRDILWLYKWLLENAQAFYQISLEQFELFCEDFKKRCIQHNYSLRAYYQFRFLFYQNIDKDKVKEYYEEFSKCNRDDMSDCHACERSKEVEFFLTIGEKDKADSRFLPLSMKKLTCADEPENTYGIYLRYYNQELAKGNVEYMDAAKKICEKVRHAIVHKGTATTYTGDILMYYAIAEQGKALDYYKKNWNFFEKNRNPMLKFWFATAAVHLFNHLKDKKSYKMSMPTTFPFYNEENVYDVGQLKTYYLDYAQDIAVKMDKRNGTNYYEKILELMTVC